MFLLDHPFNISIKIILKTYLNDINTFKSNLNSKQNEILYLKSYKTLKIKNIIKQQFDKMNNNFYTKYKAINIILINVNCRINNISNNFEKIINITNKNK